MNLEKQKAKKTVSLRYSGELIKVGYNQDWSRKNPKTILYYMYRGLSKKNGWRYDITVIPPRMMAEEFVKTKGHCHQKGIREIYTVLSGSAIYLLQKENKGKIEDVYAIKAKKGETVVIPAEYNHVAINPSSKILKMANWLPKGAESDYGFLAKHQGACYHYLKSGWKKNKNYREVPKLKFKKPLKEFPKEILD